ncbi:MAG: TetR/AcrR family transcriptional regulator [Actinomycetales bacterium]|nr:TetR/AcrR family transcriptional regulator [Actinomycetales bacterium]
MPPPTRRERVRAATVQEIKQVTRRLLVERGPQQVSLRAIAREMGMTAPGLYRYFPSYDDLLVELVADMYGELADLLIEEREAVPGADPGCRLVVTTRAFRAWAVAHPREYGLLFASPVPSLKEIAAPPHSCSSVHLSGMRFGNVFVEAFFELWGWRPFPVPADDELPGGLVSQFVGYRAELAELYGDEIAQVPLGAFHVFLACWVRLYGLVALEVFSHLHFCLTDVEPFFEANLEDLAAQLGIPAETVRRGRPVR